MENKANDLSDIKNINVNEPRSIYTVYSQLSTFKSPIQTPGTLVGVVFITGLSH